MSKIVANKWLTVILLWFVALLNYLDRQFISTLKIAMQNDIQELNSAIYFGYLMAIFLWIYAFVSPFSGMIADKFSRKKIIIGSLSIWSLITLLMSFSQNFNQLFILRALMGLSEALYLPAALSLISDYHESKNKSIAIGIHMTGLYMGQALGGFGASIAKIFSWQKVFFIFGITGIGYAILLLFFLKEIRTTHTPSKISNIGKAKKENLQTLYSLFSNISFWIILFIFTIPSLSGWGIKNWLPTLFSINLNIGMEKAGPLSTITIAVSSFLGVLFGGFISDKWVIKNLKGRIYTSAIGLFFTIPSLLLIGFGHTLFYAISAAILFGIGFGMFDANNMPIVCQFISSRQRATAYGFMNMLGVIAGAVITNLFGKSTNDGHLGEGFAFLSIFILFAIIVQLLFLKPKYIEFN